MHSYLPRYYYIQFGYQGDGGAGLSLSKKAAVQRQTASKVQKVTDLWF